MSQNNQVILSTRVRVSRNLTGYKFNSVSTNLEKKEILNLVKSIFFDNNKNSDFEFYNISRLSKIQRQFFLERHILSPEMTYKLNFKGLILKKSKKSLDEVLSILINEEDHLKIQSIVAGLDIEKAYKNVVVMEKLLERRLKFAYDKDFGYLTSSPVNLGTALRISTAVHIPAIIISGKVEEFIKKLNKIGCMVKGFLGENSEVIGNILLVANQMSLGKYEKQFIEEMNAICLNIIDEEKEALEELKKDIPLIVEDSVMRSYGILTNARLLSYYEAIDFISMINLGIDLGLIKDVKPFNLYNLINILGDSNLIINFKLKLEPDSDELDKVRMDVVREKLAIKKLKK